MSPKKQIEPGELFFRFYKKRVSSFLLTVYRAGITGKDKDIHKLRVDLKKVNALFNFFEMLQFSGFAIKGNARQFREIFRQAGKIREIQVNLQTIDKYNGSISGIIPFKRFLKKEQKKHTRAFISAIIRLDEKKLQEGTASIKKICRNIHSGDILIKSGYFLYRKAGIIRKLAEHPENEENIHRIRQDLKKMGAIASLLQQVSSGQEIKRLVSKIRATEIRIGEWHDRIILLASIDEFTRSGAGMVPGNPEDPEGLVERIKQDNSECLEAIMPMVNDLTEFVIQKPSNEKVI